MPKSKTNLKEPGAASNINPARPKKRKYSKADSYACNGVQCEMGIETFRRYWSASDYGLDENAIVPDVRSTQPMDEDPLGNMQEEEFASGTSDRDICTINSIAGESDEFGSTDIDSSQQVQVKLEPEDSNIRVVSTCTVVADKEADMPATNSSDTQVKVEQSDGVLNPGNSPLIIITNQGGGAVVTAPPALHWIIPKSLGTVSDSAKQNVVSANGNIQATITLTSSDLNHSVALVGKEGGVLTFAPTTETGGSTEIPKTLINNEACSQNSILVGGFASIIKSELLTCGDCIDVFTDPLEYEKHCASHNNCEPFKCLYCHKRFNGRLELSTHMSEHSEKSFLCDKCQMSFSHHDKFIAHCRSHEQGTLPDASDEVQILRGVSLARTFQCSQCGKAFRDADLLKHHEFTHNEGELFPCDQCGKTFRHESRLWTHLKLHLKTQTCDLCNEVFTNIYDYNEHYITHKHGLKDYECIVCKLSCNNILSLRKHASTHGLRVHWCGDCGGSGHVEYSDDNGDSQEVICLDEELFSMGDGSAQGGQPEHSTETCEEDPLALDNVQSILNNDSEEVEVEVKVDEVFITNDNVEDYNPNEEADVATDADTKDEIEQVVRNGKRKHQGKTKETSQDEEPEEEPVNNRPKRTKQQAKNCEATPSKNTRASKATKKKEDESQLEVRLELRNRSKRRKASGPGQEVLLAT